MRLAIETPVGAIILTSEVIVQHNGRIFIACRHCEKIAAVETAFGWRKMGTQLRNQPWCRACRTDARAGRNRTICGPAEIRGHA